MSSGLDRTYDNSYDNFVNNQNRFSPVFGQQDAEKNHDNVGDFTSFYIVITICTIIGCTLFILNIFLGCCSQYSQYWNDRHTGNRWIVSLWTATPHNQPALDYSTELQEIRTQKVIYHHPQYPETPEQEAFVELKTQLKSQHSRESEI